jgi:hypothetical protein
VWAAAENDENIIAQLLRTLLFPIIPRIWYSYRQGIRARNFVFLSCAVSLIVAFFAETPHFAASTKDIGPSER